MKLKIFTIWFLFLFLLAQKSDSQQWIKYFGGSQEDKAYAITIDNSGYIYIAGYSKITGHGADFCTVKINPQTGTAVWTKYYNGPASQDDKVYSITVDKLNNVYVAGTSMGPGTGTDITVVKYSSGGTQQWVGRYNSTTNGDDGALAVAVDDSSNVYLAGYVSLVGLDMYIIKFNSIGTIQWGRFYGGTANEDDKAYAIKIDENNGVYIGGYSVNTSTRSDFTLIKYNRFNGDSVWVRKYDSPVHLNDIAVCMDMSDSYHIYLAGSTEENQGNVDALTVGFNTDNGQINWARKYGGPGNWDDKVYAITVDKLDNIYVTGSTTTLADNISKTNLMTIKYNSLGDTVWTAAFDTNAANCIGKALCLSQSNEYLFVTGSTTKGSIPDSQNIATVKYDALTGEKIEASIINGAGNGEDDVYGIVADSVNDVYLGGYMTNTSDSLDIFVSKYYRGDLIEVRNISAAVPKNFMLYQNYPNPFNPSTTIKFDIKQWGTARIVIYDLLGRLADVIVNENLRPGTYEVTYSPSKLSSGIYFYELASGDYKEIRKMIFVK